MKKKEAHSQTKEEKKAPQKHQPHTDPPSLPDVPPPLGWLLISLGLFGLLAPILPGWPFLILGILILTAKTRSGQKWNQWLHKRYPQSYRKAIKLSHDLSQKWEKKFPRKK